jgi:hypothetical protein
MVGNIVLVDARARSRPGALENIEILQQERHPGERTVWKPVFDLPLGIFVMLHDHRIDLWIDPGGPRDSLVQ